MVRIVALAAALVVSGAALGQNYNGMFTTTNPQGSTVTLVLKQDAQNQVKGTLSGNNNTFQVLAQATQHGLMGSVTGAAGNLYLMAQYEGASLVVILAEPGPTGQPNLQAARRIVFARAGAGTAPGVAPAPKKEAAPKTAGGADAQLTALLTRNAWCSFTYNQRTGTSTRERVVLQSNGVMLQSSGAETYSSGRAGTVAGQYGGGSQSRWKVANGMLHLSQDGVNWAPQPLQVTQNSNGYPIIKSGGKEYMQCN